MANNCCLEHLCWFETRLESLMTMTPHRVQVLRWPGRIRENWPTHAPTTHNRKTTTVQPWCWWTILTHFGLLKVPYHDKVRWWWLCEVLLCKIWEIQLFSDQNICLSTQDDWWIVVGGLGVISQEPERFWRFFFVSTSHYDHCMECGCWRGDDAGGWCWRTWFLFVVIWSFLWFASDMVVTSWILDFQANPSAIILFDHQSDECWCEWWIRVAGWLGIEMIEACMPICFVEKLSLMGLSLPQSTFNLRQIHLRSIVCVSLATCGCICRKWSMDSHWELVSTSFVWRFSVANFMLTAIAVARSILMQSLCFVSHHRLCMTSYVWMHLS